MTRKISIYLRDMYENMQLAIIFVGNLTFEEFTADQKTTYAVFRCLEVIGEAAKNVPESVRRNYPAIPWRDIAGMRDRLIHFYFGVNYEKVWNTVKVDIPAIQPYLDKALSDLAEEQ